RKAFPKAADKEVGAMVDTCLRIAEQNLNGVNFIIMPNSQVGSKREARRYRDPEGDGEDSSDGKYDRIPEITYTLAK
ncbi:MAG: hypothetical protein AABX71_02660, partial [Nanoarchaeota archaeon]